MNKAPAECRSDFSPTGGLPCQGRLMARVGQRRMQPEGLVCFVYRRLGDCLNRRLGLGVTACRLWRSLWSTPRRWESTPYASIHELGLVCCMIRLWLRGEGVRQIYGALVDAAVGLKSDLQSWVGMGWMAWSNHKCVPCVRWAGGMGL